MSKTYSPYSTNRYNGTNEQEYCPLVPLTGIRQAEEVLKEILQPTPLTENYRLSRKYQAQVLLKREDLQMVRSYKIRGAYNKIRSLDPEKLKYGVICASAGNHAQGVALSCSTLKIRGKIVMPLSTHQQKIEQVKRFGKGYIDIVLNGETFDQANATAIHSGKEKGMTFIPPFDDLKIIEGQATIGQEINRQLDTPPDYIFVPIGGGGLAAGIGSFFKQLYPTTKIIGVEPAGAAGMKKSIEAGQVVKLTEIDKFVDGTAVQQVGQLTFPICRQVLDDIIVLPEGKVCSTMLELYHLDSIITEPAGVLSISALDFYKEHINGKKIVCILSGSNNDPTRMKEIRERSLLYETLK